MQPLENPVSSRRQKQNIKCGLLLAAALLFPSLFASAQTSTKWPRTDFQGWTDFEVAHKLNPFTEMNVNGGLRWSDDADHLVYRRISTIVGFKVSKFLTISPAYAYFYTDSSHLAYTPENRLSLAATVAVPVMRWKVSERNLIEKRFLPAGHFWRYRNRVEISHPLKLGGQTIEAGVWDEVFHDSAVKAWSRNRIAAGGEKEISPRLRVGLYLVHQNDSHTKPGDYNAVSVIIHTRL